MDPILLNEVLRVTVTVLTLIGKFILYYAATIPLFAFVSTLQERKIWKDTPAPLSIWGLVKVFIFNILWMLIIGIGALSLVPMWISRGMGSSVSLEQNAVMEKLTAMALQKALVGNVKVVNQDKIPNIALFNPNNGANVKPAPIFIANHCSQLDLAVIYFVVRRFKWIAKQSVKYLPGVGLGMTLGGHVFIKRTGKNSKSVSNLYEQSNATIQSGIPMVIFPQGTRRVTKKLPFKDGAFKIAIDNEAPLIPISINVPVNMWNSMYPLNLLWGGGDEANEVSCA